MLALSDVADLARVQRPVVSMWRRRPVARGVAIPFPQSVRREGGQDFFDGREVVEWLVATGRGNNPDAADDLALHLSAPAELGGDERVAVGREALLALRAVLAMSFAGLDPETLIDHADEADPDDECLFVEVRALGDELPAHAAHVDALVDAARSFDEAHRRLRQQRIGRREPTVLTPGGLAFVGEVAAALALDAAPSKVRLLGLSDVGPELVAATIRALDERVEVGVVSSGDRPISRSERRERLIRGWVPQDGPADVALAAFVGGRDVNPLMLLDAIDEVQLGLAPEARGVVVGPAALLCDRLSDRALDVRRGELLRLGRLRFAARLPRGLVPTSAREAMGLWVLGPSAPGPAADRVLWAADLTGLTVDEVLDPVVADAVGATSEARGRTHAFAIGRGQRVADLLATGAPVVPAGARVAPRARRSPAEQVLRVRALITQAAPTPFGDDRLDFAVAGSVPDAQPRTRSLGSLVDARSVRLLAGGKPAQDVPMIEAGTGVRIITSATLSSAASAWVDPIDAELAHPRAPRTEPGDVVFALSPARAVVDHDGLAVVVSPARILRCGGGSGVLSDVLARVINDQVDGSREWRTWPVPIIRDASVAGLEHALRSVQQQADELRRRLASLDSLALELIQGAAAGVVELAIPSQITPDPTTPDNTTSHHSPPTTTPEGP